MRLLGIDTSTGGTAVSLVLGDGTAREARDDPPQGAHPGHATKLLALAESLLDEAGIGWSELGRIAVGVGPGTFTGLRVGVTTARGLAQSLGVELVGVGSLAALAEPALAQGRVLAVIDARRGEVFAAAFERGADGRPAALADPVALAPERLGEVPGVAGVEEGWTAVGDGAVRYRTHAEATGARVPADGDPLHLVTGEAVCRLGAQLHPDTAVVPDYRRRPDAELALEPSQARTLDKQGQASEPPRGA